MPRWLKITLKTLGVLIGILVILSVAATVYVAYNKKKILDALIKEANKNLNGTLTVGDLSPSFFSGFPGISVSLKDVVLRDSLWKQHKHDLINADKIQVTVNALALIKGTVDISKIALSNSRIFLYTDTTGYSNTSVFAAKKKKPVTKEEKEVPSIEIGKVNMDNVEFTLDNRYRKKLFHFSVNSFRADMDYPSSGWEADMQLKTLVHDLGFNTRRGSFVKNALLDGHFQITYNKEKKTIVFSPQKVDIAKTPFIIGAQFNLAKEPLAFRIHIKTPGIQWKNAARLLAPNISKKLDMFDVKNPIPVQTSITGDFGAGDPVIVVKTQVDKNTLVTPGGTLTDVHFDGLFTNANVPAKGTTNANSAIKFHHLTGNYAGIPFKADTAIIANLDTPVASGVFTSQFDIAKLNEAIGGNEAIKFNGGKADMKLNYKADIVNYRFSKPIVSGDINVREANISYVPRNINFKNSSITLSFRGNDLLLKNIRVQSGRSIVKMEGSVLNFLNFYYTDPEKIVVKWNVYSPQLYLGEFLGYLGNRRSSPQNPKKTTTKRAAVVSNRIDDLLEKSKVDMQVRVDKLFYKKFAATNAKASLFISEDGIKLSNMHVNHAGGFLNLDGNIVQKGTYNRFNLRAQVSNVNISTFFYSFDNFGIDGLSYKNLKGFFFSKINAAGNITEQGGLIPRSIDGTVVFDLKQGALVNFPPFVSVSKFALKGRGLDNITFSNLNGKFDINKEKIFINPMRISSSAINMDVGGVYSLTRGTNINIDVPLRNPKKDAEITDAKEKRERRMRGLVLHLVAKDGDDGKIKFGLR